MKCISVSCWKDVSTKFINFSCGPRSKNSGFTSVTTSAKLLFPIIMPGCWYFLIKLAKNNDKCCNALATLSNIDKKCFSETKRRINARFRKKLLWSALLYCVKLPNTNKYASACGSFEARKSEQSDVYKDDCNCHVLNHLPYLLYDIVIKAAKNPTSTWQESKIMFRNKVSCYIANCLLIVLGFHWNLSKCIVSHVAASKWLFTLIF